MVRAPPESPVSMGARPSLGDYPVWRVIKNRQQAPRLILLDGCGWLGQPIPQVGHECVEMCEMDIVACLRDGHHVDA
jgi:hypothetical protein